MLLRLFVPLLAALIGSASLAVADPVFPPGQRIGFTPPPGLTVSKHFPGFEDADRKVAIAFLDLPPRAFYDAQRSLFDESRPNVTVEKREMFPFASGIATLVTAKVESNGITVHKWLMLANVETPALGHMAALINAEVPESAGDAYPDAVIRAALATVTFRPPPLEERLKMLPFKLDAMADFRVLQVMPSSVILIDGPGNDLIRHAYIVVDVGQGSPSEPDDRARFARDILMRAPLRDLVITSGEPMRIGGLPGFEIRARAKQADGSPLALVQWLRFGTGGFMSVVGVSPQDEWDKLFPRFRAVRDGVNQR
jgi:hypothetical protein